MRFYYGDGAKWKEGIYVQFVAILHLLKYSKPMIDFAHIRGWFDFEGCPYPKETLDRFKWVGNGNSHTYCGFESNYFIGPTSKISISYERCQNDVMDRICIHFHVGVRLNASQQMDAFGC